MTATALSKEQSQTLGTVINKLAKDCDAKAVVICDIGGYILASESQTNDKSIETAAALAAGSFAATRELAGIVGEEEGFKSICHRGVTSGVLIQALGDNFLILVILGEKSIEGLVRLHLKKITKQIETIVNATQDQSVHAAGATGSFSVQENDASKS
ncbi:MAG: roadblock/LC7 domain-containing protein [Lentisphaerae bacterium]|nr:roadblock/LC7 domain-containing protein [Lentisphaerota bacterium]